MTDRLYLRQVTDSHYQWRRYYESGHWDEAVHAGTLALFAETAAAEPLPLCLLLSGQQVVLRHVPVEDTERKLLAKLLPYEMEEQLIDPVEELHFAFGAIADEHVDVLYLDVEVMQQNLTALSEHQADPQHVLPDYLLLDHQGFDGVLLLDGEVVLGKFGPHRAFATEINLAPFVLSNLLDELKWASAQLRLVADSVENLAILKSALPDAFVAHGDTGIEEQLGSYWECVDGVLPVSLNLRSGAFGRRLPIERWWKVWQMPAYVAAAAFALALAVNFVAYQSAKSESMKIRQEIQRVYLQAVPNGRPGDEESKLKKLLEGEGGAGAGQPSNLIPMLGGIAGALKAQKDIQISTFRYSGDQREMNLNIEVKGLSELGQFRDALAGQGLETESPRTSRNGEVYQASMKVTEKN